MASNRVTLSATGNTLLASAGAGAGPDGWLLSFSSVGWTGSLVLKQDQSAPGQAQNLVSVAYQNGNTFAPVAAGTAITVSTTPYVVQLTGYDLYAVYTHTAGTVTITVTPANNASGGGGGTAVAAGDVTSGTFGSFTGDVGTYTFPAGINAGGALSGVTTLNMSGALTAGAISGTTIATSGNGAVYGTPLVASTGFKKFSVGTGTGLFSDATSSYLMQNVDVDAAGANYVYIASAAATRYWQTSGVHYFSHAASGTAGNPITWVNDLTIASTGAATFASSVKAVSIKASGAYILDEASTVFMDFNGGGGRIVAQGPSTNTRPTLSLLLTDNAGGAGVTALAFATTGAATFASTVAVTGGFGCNGAAAQTKYASGGTLAGVVAALVANGILSN